MSKTAIITGGNKGIGLAVAKDLISKNYKVIIGCRDISKGKMAEEYLGKNAHLLELDLSKPASVLQFVKQINTHFSEIDVLYNNAGLIYRDFELTEEGYESMIAVNYFGAYRLALMLLENLHRSSGRIVQVTSLSMYLARKFNWFSDFGQFADPLADKCLIIATLLAFAFSEKLPLWFVYLILSRDGIILIGAMLHLLLFENRQALPNRWGKHYTGWIIALFIIVLTQSAFQILPYYFEWIAMAGVTFFIFLSLFTYLWNEGKAIFKQIL